MGVQKQDYRKVRGVFGTKVFYNNKYDSDDDRSNDMKYNQPINPAHFYS